MYPHERSLVEEMQNKPFVLVGVNSDTPARAKEAIAKNNLNWRSFQNKRDGKPDIAEDWAVQGWPTIVVLDADGKIRYRGHDGEQATEVAREQVALLLARK
ncbi:hypothetical protein LBMAG49_27820 [Planctomycetota bacterium]|nr:TlpA disulfide reductase family protein [Planctomycetota bacterium]GDY03453.1 hypothetical protein LBMAG49_27820 [Planctomycetota bacterium]